jgi:putative salt-induced outer membrane protein
MKIGKTLLLFSLLSLISATTQTAFSQEKNWEDTAELSYVQTGGNTEVLTLSGNNSLEYNFSENWKGTWNVGLLYGKTGGVKNAERYSTGLRADYESSDVLYYYILGGWLKDEFAGIDNRFHIGPGAGYKILTGERHNLSLEGGLSYAREAYTDEDDNSFLEGRFLGEYEFVFNPKTKFIQSAEYLHNFDDADKFRVNTVSGLTTQLTDILSLKISYEMNYQNEPPPEALEQTDTRFSVALVVNF